MSQRTRSWLRVAAFVAVVQLALGALLVREVRARTDGALSRAGRLLMEFAGAHQQTPRTVHLNGASLQLSVGNTDRGVSDVLDHFQAQCRARSGQIGQQFAEESAKRSGGRVAPVDADELLDGIYRVDNEAHGVIACLDVGAQRLSIDGLRARVAAFARTGDLTQLGQLRFVSAERGDKATVFAALWSEGAINLKHMFPQHGDAPGHDLVGVPRPERSRRVLSSWEAGQPKSIQAYLVSTSEMDVQRGYRQQLVDAGFKLVGDPSPQVPGFVAQRGERSLVVAFVARDAANTLLTISSLDEATRSASGR